MLSFSFSESEQNARIIGGMVWNGMAAAHGIGTASADFVRDPEAALTQRIIARQKGGAKKQERKEHTIPSNRVLNLR